MPAASRWPFPFGNGVSRRVAELGQQLTFAQANAYLLEEGKGLRNVQNRVKIFFCCVMLIGAILTELMSIFGRLHDPLRQGVAIFAGILAASLLRSELRKPVVRGG
ncbi:hypothetical protein ASF09_19410 [Sphingomonas sp. Leaf242]|nr:hypothetical protein ASF09_19410 [Sphingomonas sp. Leaf242]